MSLDMEISGMSDHPQPMSQYKHQCTKKYCRIHELWLVLQNFSWVGRSYVQRHSLWNQPLTFKKEMNIFLDRKKRKLNLILRIFNSGITPVLIPWNILLTTSSVLYKHMNTKKNEGVNVIISKSFFIANTLLQRATFYSKKRYKLLQESDREGAESRRKYRRQ